MAHHRSLDPASVRAAAGVRCAALALCRALALCGALALAGCGGPHVPDAPTDADLAREIRVTAPPGEAAGVCWATDATPAIIETVTDNIAEPPSEVQDAGYRTEIRQAIVSPRQQIWFRAPCDAELTGDVITTLQRALAVRGFYTGDPTGLLDPPTRAAIRAYQTRHGLNSDRLSLAAARNLGVIAADLGQLPPPAPAAPIL